MIPTIEAFEDLPIYWFSLLEIARQDADDSGFHEAKKGLRRLGIEVVYPGDSLIETSIRPLLRSRSKRQQRQEGGQR